MKKFFAIAIVCVASLAVCAEGDDFAFVYRGRISAQSGTIPEELVVTYSLYVGENDTAWVWQQVKTEHPNPDGTFQSVLSGSGLRAAFADSKATFLGIRLRDDAEQFPRQEILAAPLTDFADAVTDVPSDPVFVNAAVREVNADTMTVKNLTIANSLTLPSSSNLALGGINVSNNARLTVKKPANGSVSLFSGQPRYWSLPDGIDRGQNLDCETSKGGLVVAITDHMQGYLVDAPCITWPVGPGKLNSPFEISGPVRMYFYEFSGN